MDIETRRRIKAYQNALPDLRERVIAVALLLAMSASMLTSASFAWLTISRRPEVSGVSTTVAANGSLEIALATGTSKSPITPDESEVGDSSAAKNQSVSAANITWGNLVNLSDSSYGLQNMILRPAQLNQSALLTSPLYGAAYGQDGRTENLTSSFAYATWTPANPDMGITEDGFQVNDNLGVRAITSVTIEAKGFAHQVLTKRNAADEINAQAGNQYLAITQNSEWMDSLGVVMGTFLTAELNSENPSMNKSDVINMRDVFGAFVEVYKTQLQAMVNLVNYQLFLMNNSESGSTEYGEYDAETLLASSVTEASLQKAGIKLPGLNQFKKDYTMLQTNYAALVEIAKQGSVTYDDMKDICNSLVNVGTCTINGKSVNALSADKSQAISMVMDSSTKTAVITNGVLYNFENLNGARCDVKNLAVPAKYIISVTVKANISTNATAPSQFFTGLDYADGLNQGGAGEKYPQDTYGMAVDLWVRTNAASSFLTLEGNVLTEEEIVYPTITVNGEEKDLYTVNLNTSDEGDLQIGYTVDVYRGVNSEGVEGWFDAHTFKAYTEEELQGQTPVRKVEKVQKIVGYEGENRIWDDWRINDYLSTDSTTQGSGSCYTYYADTPEDRARSLALLESFKVAFVGADGSLLASASMDTKNYYAASGRVIVPLVLDTDSCITIPADATGEVTYAITPLEKNVPTRITALIYLDGTKLTNDEVLAAADIQGQLNIQFGSSENMEPVKNDELESKVLRVSASVDVNEFDFDTATSDMISNVTVRVEGDNPSTVTAFFLREINASQGTREKSITFQPNGDGTWSAQQKFVYPGNYVLRTIQLNGVEYTLAEPIRVTVKGFAISSLTCSEEDADGKIYVMTADYAKTVNLSLGFQTDDRSKMPQTVQGRYIREDGAAVNVDFTYNPTTTLWSGSATFVTSGKYTLQYLLLDGQYTELDEERWKSVDITLGMRVELYTDSPIAFTYTPNEWDEVEDDELINLYMKAKIRDNANNEKKGLTNVTLYYSMWGSSDLANGMSTTLEWDGEWYTGVFRSKPGTFNFSQLTVGEGTKKNTITNAPDAPRFEIVSPIPPKFGEGKTNPYQFVPNNNAVMKLTITDYSAGTVYADILKTGTTDPVAVQGALNENGEWEFPVPKNLQGKQDGNWTIRQIRMIGVYDDNGVFRGESNPLIWDMTGKDGVMTKVVSDVVIEVSGMADNDLGKTGDVIDGTFLQNYDISGINIKVTDFEGNKVDGVTLQLGYTYSTNTSYGGFSASLTDAGIDSVPLTSSDGINFTQSSSFKVMYAGKYTPVLQYSINGSTPASANVPGIAFNVWSKAPEVSITDITMDGAAAYSIDKNKSGSLADTSTYKKVSSGCLDDYVYTCTTNKDHVFAANNTEYISRIESGNKTAWIYFKCDHSDETTYSGGTVNGYDGGATFKGHTYSYNNGEGVPRATITLTGMGTTATNARLVFTKSGGGDVIMVTDYTSRSGKYTGNTSTHGTDRFEWTANGTCTRYIGVMANGAGSASSDTKTVADTITSSTLILTYNGTEFTFTVPTITIHNPY